MTKKKCSKCNKKKPLSGFYTRYGQPIDKCKECYKIVAKEQYQKHRKKILKKMKAKYKKDPDKFIVRVKMYQQTEQGKEKNNAAKRERRKKYKKQGMNWGSIRSKV